jgi:hypothetical protein
MDKPVRTAHSEDESWSVTSVLGRYTAIILPTRCQRSIRSQLSAILVLSNLACGCSFDNQWKEGSIIGTQTAIPIQDGHDRCY